MAFSGGSERDRARELQARTEKEIENLRKEIKGNKGGSNDSRGQEDLDRTI